MGKILKYICTIFIIQASFSCAENLKVADFALLDHKGEFQQLYRYSNSKAVVLFVHGVGCPIVRHNINALKLLRENYNKKGIIFLFFNANLQDEREDIVKEALDFQIDFPILKDQSQLVAQMLNLHRTAEVLLISTKDWKVVYRGPVDDRLGYETQKQRAQKHFLESALKIF